MPAPKRVPDADVLRAIALWRGRVVPAAEAVGIHPKNFRQRLAALGVDLEALRKGNVPVRIERNVEQNVSDPASAVVPMEPKSSGRDVSIGGVYQFPVEAPRFGGVSAAAAKAEEVPIATVKARHQPTRLTPPQQDLLRSAKFDLMGRYKVETDENAILQQFFDETFEAWLRSKLTGEMP